MLRKCSVVCYFEPPFDPTDRWSSKGGQISTPHLVAVDCARVAHSRCPRLRGSAMKLA